MEIRRQWPRMASAGLALALASTLGAQPATAQLDNDTETNQAQRANQAQRSDQSAAPLVAAGDWNYDRIYDAGWSLERLLDEAEVYGGNGDDIGNLENVLIGDDGKIEAVIAEVGGFLDIGDTHVAVPWDRIYISADLENVETPVLEDEAEDYSPFKEVYRQKDADDLATVSSDVGTGGSVWKATRLLDEYAYLPSGDAFGYIDDLIFIGPQLHALVVSSDVGYGGGFVALPYSAEGFDDERQRYNVGYNRDEIAQLERFDYDRMADEVDVGTIRQDRVGTRRDQAAMRQDRTATRQDRTGIRQDQAAMRQDRAATRQDRVGMRQDQAGARQDRTATRQDRTQSGGEVREAQLASDSDNAQKRRQADHVAELRVEESDRYGPYLTDDAGRALYLFEADTQGKQGTAAESACYDQCAKAWPPLRSSDMPQARDRVKAGMLGTIEREDGVKQVTYNGWPLYYFVKDEERGSTAGQDVEGFGAEWYLVTPAGKAAHAEEETEEGN